MCGKEVSGIEVADPTLYRGTTFILTPLIGGLDPKLSWQGLRLFEESVWPHVKHLRD